MLMSVRRMRRMQTVDGSFVGRDLEVKSMDEMVLVGRCTKSV